MGKLGTFKMKLKFWIWVSKKTSSRTLPHVIWCHPLLLTWQLHLSASSNKNSVHFSNFLALAILYSLFSWEFNQMMPSQSWRKFHRSSNIQNMYTITKLLFEHNINVLNICYYYQIFNRSVIYALLKKIISDLTGTDTIWLDVPVAKFPLPKFMNKLQINVVVSFFFYY